MGIWDYFFLSICYCCCNDLKFFLDVVFKYEVWSLPEITHIFVGCTTGVPDQRYLVAVLFRDCRPQLQFSGDLMLLCTAGIQGTRASDIMLDTCGYHQGLNLLFHGADLPLTYLPGLPKWILVLVHVTILVIITHSELEPISTWLLSLLPWGLILISTKYRIELPIGLLSYSKEYLGSFFQTLLSNI